MLAMFNLYFALTVLTCVVVHCIHYVWRTYQENKVNIAIAKRHGCQPPPLPRNHRPLRVDRLEQTFQANADGRLMDLILFHFHRTGSTVKQVFFLKPAYETIDPANPEAMQSTQFQGTASRFDKYIFLTLSRDWGMGRSGEILRQPSLHRPYEDWEVFKSAVNDLLDAISDEATKHGNVVDLQRLFFRLTLDTTTSFLFRESVQSLKQPEVAGEQNFAYAFDVAQEYLAKRFRVPDLYRLIGGPKFHQACRTVHEFTDRIIDRNLTRDRKTADDGGKYVFLDSLAANTRDRIALGDHVVNTLAARRDTTACLLSWTL